MTNDDLKKNVEHPDIPDLDEQTRDRIVTVALNRYREAGHSAEKGTGKTFGEWLTPAFKPALALAACLVLIIAVNNRMPSDTNTPDGSPLAADGYNLAVFEEYQSLFQHELKAVVAHDGEVDVVLGGQELAQSNPVVFIRIKSKGQPVFITAYSGQTIDTKIDGRNVKIEILTTSDHGVLLASDEFLLENGVVHGPDDLHADAHVLETRL